MSRIAICLALLVPLNAFALATEAVGNDPIMAGWGWHPEMYKAVNVHARVYWFEVNGNPYFYFKGTPKELNAAIRQFMAIPAEKREIILLAGPGKRQTLGGDKAIEYDWELHVPGGFAAAADTRTTLTIRIDSLLPAAAKDPAKIAAWIQHLNSDEFTTREKAANELEALGATAAKALREALKTIPTPEGRERLERLIAKASVDIRLDVLELPENVRVVTVEGLAERARKDLDHKEHDTRGHAITRLGNGYLPPAEILPDLERALKHEKHEYPLRCATSVAYRMGAAAKPLLPSLKELMQSTDKNVVASAKQAIEQIEKAKPIAADEAAAKRLAAIRLEIKSYVDARSKYAE